MDTGVLDFFNKKLILDYYFWLKSGPVFLFQIFIIAPLLIMLFNKNCSAQKAQWQNKIIFIAQ
jgi:hypothetical protein